MLKFLKIHLFKKYLRSSTNTWHVFKFTFGENFFNFTNFLLGKTVNFVINNYKFKIVMSHLSIIIIIPNLFYNEK